VINCGNWCGISYVVSLHKSVSIFVSTLPFCPCKFCSLLNHKELLLFDASMQIRNNPAALLALCWYWATDGVGSKVWIR